MTDHNEANDCVVFIDDALESMVAIAVELGDVLANTRPDPPGTNSPYAILTHCLGVMDFWAGHMIAGRPIRRDREAEFHAQGSVEELQERAHRAREQLHSDLQHFSATAKPRGIADPIYVPADRAYATVSLATQRGALLHVMQELTQHCGQMEITRDLLRSPRGN